MGGVARRLGRRPAALGAWKAIIIMRRKATPSSTQTDYELRLSSTSALLCTKHRECLLCSVFSFRFTVDDNDACITLEKLSNCHRQPPELVFSSKVDYGSNVAKLGLPTTHHHLGYY